MSITSEQLAELKKLAEKATQGEWPYLENLPLWGLPVYGRCQPRHNSFPDCGD